MKSSSSGASQRFNGHLGGDNPAAASVPILAMQANGMGFGGFSSAAPAAASYPPAGSPLRAGFSMLVGTHTDSLHMADDKGRRAQSSWLHGVMDYGVRAFVKLGPTSRIITLLVPIAGLIGLSLVVFLACDEFFISFNFGALCMAACFLLFAFWLLAWIIDHTEGDSQAVQIAHAIRDGAEGFYLTQNSYITKISVTIAGVLFVSYALRESESFPEEIRAGISPLGFALLSASTFLLGAFSSALSGYAGVWVSVRANSRVAAAAHRNYEEALRLCFRGGAFSSIVNVSLAVGSLASLMIVCHLLFPKIPLLKLPLLLVGFGFGASLVALFAQLGGGIYTKAADVGADLVGKVEAGIPEDDYRNPAVIADLVGDNVGDCAGQCADVFESLAAEMLAAMILGSALASEANLSERVAAGFVLFPLAVHAMDLVISTVAVLFVGRTPSGRVSRSLLPIGSPTRDSANARKQNPLKEMVTIYFITCVAGTLSFTFLCWLLLNPAGYPGAWVNFALCGMSGIACALIFLVATQYYTDYNYAKVQSIAQASLTGPATNIIAGLAIGMESTAIPIVAISCAIVFAYHEGLTSGIAPDNPTLAGLFGTAVATMGMLCTAVYVLSMSSFGPIADNAGGIVEMTGSSSAVREITDRLDAVGNVTKANTKGFSVGTAALASFLLFSAFLDEVSIFVKRPFKIVDITSPDVFVGGMLGGGVIFLFSSMAMMAVGKTAGEVVNEVRRQFRERPNIMTYTELPDYKRCVQIVSESAVKQMLLPGLVACFSPLVVGVAFKFIGASRNNPLLGVEALGAFMMFATSTGILMALFLNNGGGAWDNAKKYIETGVLGGKGSDAHKAAVVGDTVGDPCKDTAGPSVHVLIKLIATVTLVMTPLFVSYGA